MRGERLVSILLFLQSHKQMTAKDLAERLEVSQRTIYRDMEALSRTGIPVIVERGKQGGWSLLDNYQTQLTGLKESEIKALFVPPSTQLLEQLGLTRTSEEARNKLIASLPAKYRQNAKEVWNRIHVDTSTWHKRKERMVSFEILKKAIWSEQKLIITYQRADGDVNILVVKPLGLVAKGSRWYFVASKENNDIRTYRVSRIQSAIQKEETFERPKDFNLAQYWEASTKAFIENLPHYEVSVKVSPFILPWLTFSGRLIKKVEVEGLDPEWIPVRISFNTEDEAVKYLLGFADHIKEIEPRVLHNRILERAKTIVAIYEQER